MSEPHRDTPIEIDLRARPHAGPPAGDQKRFDIFLVDTGWNAPVSKAVRSHLPLLYEFARQDSLYILDHEMSIEVLRNRPDMIGHDPALIVYDRYSPRDCKPSFRGFHLNLGRMKSPEQALARLQEFIRFVLNHRTVVDLGRVIRRDLHRQGFEGAIKVLRETTSEMI